MKSLKEIYHEIRSPNLNEEITRKELAPMLDSFVSFASDKLGLKSLPNVRYKDDGDDYNSFAAYNPSSNELSVSTINRHPMDIFRSIAHELVHHKQNEDGRLGHDVEKEGSTGSDIENEANSEAGKIMRWFAKANPNMFSKTHVVESTNSAGINSGIRGLGNVTGEPVMTDDVVSNYVAQNMQDTANMQNDSTNLYTNIFDQDWWMSSDDKKTYTTKTGSKPKAILGVKPGKSQKAVSMNEEKKTAPQGVCWPEYKMVGMKKKNGKKVPNCVPVDESFEEYMKNPFNREIGKDSTTYIYKTMTPGQEPGAQAPDASKRKKLAQEDAGLPKGAFDLSSMNDGIGPTFSLRASPALVTGFAQIGSTLAEASPSIRQWALKEDTQRKFFNKYGNNAPAKLLEACKTLEEAGCGCQHSKPKTLRKIKESFDKGIMDIKPIGIGMYRPHMDTVDEDWSDVNRKDKTDGMSQKAVDAYRRENPGSKLQTAVTEKKPTGKRKKRRLSFCRRMKGMKKRLTSAETARDPDSDINNALRRWNCKE